MLPKSMPMRFNVSLVACICLLVSRCAASKLSDLSAKLATNSFNSSSVILSAQQLNLTQRIP